MHIKRFVNLLSDHMKEKFPEIEIGFYVSKRTNYEHMGKDSPLFSYLRHSQITDQLQNFMSDELDERFKLMFSQLVSAIKWKYDYIIFRKKVNLKKQSKSFFVFSAFIILNSDD